MIATPPHQAIYRRWRAQTFAEIVGQGPVVETLRNAVRAGRVSHAILFVGPRGTGKTSLARILAKAVNCTDLRDGDPCDLCPSCVSIREGTALDVLEIDAASNRGIQDVKDLRDALNYAPSSLSRKVYILDEAHQITRDAWNALLKSLEEPPEFVVFIFASTHPQGFPPAILSRLQRYDVRSLTVPEIRGKLERILAAEGIEAEPAAVELIARLAAGGMRDAESMLDQLLASAGGRIDEARVRDLLGLATAEALDHLLTALLTGDAAAGFAVLDELEERGRDVGVVLEQLIDAIRAELTAGLGSVGADPARTGGLARVARRLASIDPERRGPGGLRLQVELALFEGLSPVGASASRAVAVPKVVPTPEAASSTTPAQPVAPASPPTRGAARRPDSPSPEIAPAPSAATKSSSQAGPAEPASAPPVAEPGGDLGALLSGWAEITASVGPATRALILECRPLAVDGSTVTLGFPESKPFLKAHAERKGADLEAAVGRFLGRLVAVRCVATNLDLLPPLPPGEETADFLAEARRIFGEDLVDVGEVS